MALPILDGNQTATTLSTVVLAGAHIPAHTVVSLGSQAITDMRSAVSGSVVSISNFPATQTISGTVTANLNNTNLNTVTIGVRGTVTASGLVNATGADNSTLVPGFPIVFNDAIAEQPEFRQINVANPLPVRAYFTTVTVGNSVTIGSLPKPTWTDYSGTVVTAGSAVTAINTTTRSYLLAQVTTGQMFLNIGATATTLNSIYFSAGQGFAWETSVPQGIVSIISSVTGTNYVLKGG